jgi:hypothetical protein
VLFVTEVAAAGLEQFAETPEIGGIPTERGTKSGTVGAESELADPDLIELVNAWPTLPEATRASILAMVRTAKGGQR